MDESLNNIKYVNNLTDWENLPSFIELRMQKSSPYERVDLIKTRFFMFHDFPCLFILLSRIKKIEDNKHFYFIELYTDIHDKNDIEISDSRTLIEYIDTSGNYENPTFKKEFERICSELTISKLLDIVSDLINLGV